jgi:hypothetical protein
VGSDLPLKTRDFIARHIISVGQLEILLLLHEHKERRWTAREITLHLRSEETSVEKWLGMLVALRLAAQVENTYHFAPATEELASGTLDLAEAYRARRIKVIELIFSKPNENLLNFVRAFDLRKRP